MSGHSKWHSIKHQKAINDGRRGKLFTKLAADITIAAKSGIDPDMNPKLRLAITKAKQSNMPNTNIDRAIARGSGANASNLEELTYEGYFSGAAVVVKCLSDNRNRINAEIRHLFSKNGASIGSVGSVEYLFKTVGVIEILDLSPEQIEDISLIAIENNAIDLEVDASSLTIIISPQELDNLVNIINSNNQEISISSEVRNIADSNVELNSEESKKLSNLINLLNDNDDVVEVFGNYILS